MLTVIKICRKSQKEPAFPEITKENFSSELDAEGIAILEKGMVSGKTSVGIVLKDKDGKYFMTQLSADQINHIKSAISGAESFWKDNPE